MENYREKNYCNITKWNEKGYTGKNQVVAFLDEMTFFKHDYIEVPFGRYTQRTISHGDRTIEVFHQIAPDAKIYLLPRCPTENIVGYDVDWIIQHGITLINVSMTGAWFTDEEIDKLLENNVKIIAGAGNESTHGETAWLADDRVLGVGAVSLKLNDIMLENYSSRGFGYVDCMGFSNISILGTKGMCGTSYSSPWVTGMLALYEQKFREENNRVPNSNEIREFIYSNCEDLGQPGVDKEYGHGLFILPDLEDKEIIKTVPKTENIRKEYTVEVYSDSEIVDELKKLRYEPELTFYDGCNYRIYTVFKTANKINAEITKAALIRFGYDADITINDFK